MNRFHSILLLSGALSFVVMNTIQAQESQPSADTTPKKLYKITKPSGEVIYSDQPMKGAQEIDVPSSDTNVVPSVQTPQFRPFDPGRKSTKSTAAYETFVITSPANDETIWDTGEVKVEASLSPGLRGGHALFFMFDGHAYEREELRITYENVDRGSHSIWAEIRDAAGQVVQKTPSVTVHVKRPIAK